MKKGIKIDFDVEDSRPIVKRGSAGYSLHHSWLNKQEKTISEKMLVNCCVKIVIVDFFPLFMISELTFCFFLIAGSKLSITVFEES